MNFYSYGFFIRILCIVIFCKVTEIIHLEGDPVTETDQPKKKEAVPFAGYSLLMLYDMSLNNQSGFRRSHYSITIFLTIDSVAV